MGFTNSELYAISTNLSGPRGLSEELSGMQFYPGDVAPTGYTRVPVSQCVGCDQDSRHQGFCAVDFTDLVSAAAESDRIKHQDIVYAKLIAALNIFMAMVAEGIPAAADYPPVNGGNVSREITLGTFNGSDPATVVYTDDPGLAIGTPCMFLLTNSAVTQHGGWIAYPDVIDTGANTIHFVFVSASSFTRADEKVDPDLPILAKARVWNYGCAPNVPVIADLAHTGTEAYPEFPVYPADGPGDVVDPLAPIPELLTSYPWCYKQFVTWGAQELVRNGCPSLWSLAGVELGAIGGRWPGRNYMDFGTSQWGSIATWIDSVTHIPRAGLRHGIEHYEDAPYELIFTIGGIRHRTLYGDDSDDTNDPEEHYVSCLAGSRMNRHGYYGGLSSIFLGMSQGVIAALDFRDTVLVVPKIAAGTAVQIYPGLTFQRKYLDANMVECAEGDAVYGEIIQMNQTILGRKDESTRDLDQSLFTRTVAHSDAFSGGFKFYLRHESMTIKKIDATGYDDYDQTLLMGATSVMIGPSRRPNNWGASISKNGAGATGGIMRGRCIRLKHDALADYPILAGLRYPVMIARSCDVGFTDPAWASNALTGVPGFDKYVATAGGCDSIEVLDNGGMMAVAMALIAVWPAGGQPTIEVLPGCYAKGTWNIWTGDPMAGSDTAVSSGVLALTASGLFALPVGLTGQCRVLKGAAAFRVDLPQAGADYPDGLYSSLWMA